MCLHGVVEKSTFTFDLKYASLRLLKSRQLIRNS